MEKGGIMILCFHCQECGCEWNEESDHAFEDGDCPCCETPAGKLVKILNENSLEVDWAIDQDEEL